MGLSCGAGVVRGSVRRVALLLIRYQFAQFAVGIAGDSGGGAGVLLVCARKEEYITKVMSVMSLVLNVLQVFVDFPLSVYETGDDTTSRPEISMQSK